MKKLLSLVVSLIMITELVLGYTVTVTIDDVGLRITSEEGNIIQEIPAVEIEGWEVESGGVTITDNQFVMPGGNVVIKGILPKEKYTVSYDANGGTGAPGSQLKEEGETLTLSTVVPTRDGYTFLGWSINSGAINAEYSAGGSFILNRDTTLYAVWSSSSYTLTVNPGGATYAGNYNSSCEITAPAQSYIVTFYYNYEGSGGANTTQSANRVFSGWSQPVIGSINDLMASTATYVFGTGNETITANYGAAEAITLPDGIRSGYELLGWSESNTATEAEYQVGDSYIPESDKALYGVWREEREDKEWNEPVLANGLTPVNWNGTAWEATDEENWDYNYELASTWSNSVGSSTYGVEGDGTAKWANAQTADGSLYVWIPRFTYYTVTGNNISWNADTSGTARTYILFSNGTEDYTADPTGATAYTYSKHSAFTLTDASSNTTELTGFWVAKYEASKGTNNVPQSKPGVSSWTNETISNMYTYGKDLNSTNTNIGAHMLKDNEWGAVALLTSAVGRIPYINNNSNYTGYAAETQNASTSVSNYLWSTENGVRGSTTHNVYGVYDMSGGKFEYVPSYLGNGTTAYYGNLKTSYNTSGLKYVGYYADDTSYSDKLNDIGSLNWDSDYRGAPYTNYPVFSRGGSYNQASNAGIFHSFSETGESASTYTFRVGLFGGYTVNYDANSGTGAPASQSASVDNSITISTTEPTRDGYTFLGWSTNSGATNAEYSAGGSFTLNQNTTLYAVWAEIIKYTLTVDYPTFTRTEQKAEGSSVTVTTEPADGYTFTGWTAEGITLSAEQEVSTEITFTMPGNAVTLTANYEESEIQLSSIPVGAYIAYNPVYTKNGSQVTTATVLGTDAGTLDTDNVTGIDQTFNFNDYTGGWKVMYNDGNQLTLIAAESVGNLTLGTEATVTSNETASELNGGKIGYAKAIYTLNKLCNDYANGEYAISGRAPGYSNGPDNLLGEGITLNNITRTNILTLIEDSNNPLTEPYYPYGDNYNSADISMILDTTDTEGNYILRDSDGYIWLASRYTSGTELASGLAFGVRVLRIFAGDLELGGEGMYQAYSVDGFDYYGGWYAASNSYQYGVRPIITLESGVQIVGGDGLTPETAYELAWETEPTYTISYNANGGSGAPSSQTKSSGTAITLSSTVPTRSGYNFLGWSTNSAATSAEYSAGGSFAQNANTTLYAIWGLPTLASVVNVGDYVTYTPSSTSYTVSTSASGYTSNQTFNPSATTSWRVFSISGDVVKLVSADKVQTSSNADLYLQGATGYQNAVKTLNDLCGAYVNSTYATSGRSIGSTDPWNETEVDSTKSLGVINTSTYPLTWINTYVNENSGFPYIDELYNGDVTILKNNSMLHSNEYSWLASRILYVDSYSSNFSVRLLNSSGSIENYNLYYVLSEGNSRNGSSEGGVRPVITLKSGIKKASGSGTQASPYIISQ